MQSIISNVFKMDKRNNVNEFYSILFNDIYLLSILLLKVNKITMDYYFIIYG